MTEIHRVVSAARRRLRLAEFCRVLVLLLAVALAGAVITRLVERIFGLIAMPLRDIAIYGGSAVFGLAAAWAIFRPMRDLRVARLVDEGAGTREALSTALCFAKEQDPWSRAVVDSARRTAAGVDVRRAVPFQPPRAWPWAMSLAVGLVVVWVTVPRMDVMGLFAKKEAEAKQKAEIVAVKAEVKKNEDKLNEMLSKAGVEVKKDEGTNTGEQKPQPPQTPEEVRRAAVRKLTELSDRLNDMKKGERAEQLKAVQDALQKVKQPGDGPLTELSRDLAKGDFKGANEKLDELKQKLKEGTLSDADKAKLQAQLDKLGDQIKSLAKENKELAKALEKAGMDSKQASETARQMMSNPDAMKQALQQMQNMSAEQKDALMKQLQAAMKAAGQCDKMGEGMKQMAKGMSQQGKQGQQGQQGEQSDQQSQQGAAAMSEAMSELEQMQMEAQATEAALSECKSQMAGLCKSPGEGQIGQSEQNGEWGEGETDRFGQGTGGAGRSGGGRNGDSIAADYRTEKRKADVATTQGAIISSRLVYGEQVKGESLAQFSDAVESGEKAATDAIESKQIPREYHDAVKHYFGTLGKKTGKAKPAATPAADAKPESKPAEPAPAEPKKSN
ncbi:MAG: hypothetical protein SFY96_07980 [Planctomycetota bacterium]|nr:hypothetical protein [Planctomycetota bacterium]